VNNRVFWESLRFDDSDAGWSEYDTLFLRGDINMSAGSSYCWY